MYIYIYIYIYIYTHTHIYETLIIYVYSFLSAFLPHPDSDVFVVVLANNVHKFNTCARKGKLSVTNKNNYL